MSEIEIQRCASFQALVVDWSLGALPVDVHCSFDGHISTCTACLSAALSTRRVMCCDEALALPALEHKVLSRFRAETRGRVPRPVLAGIGLAVAASLLLAAAIVHLKNRTDVSDNEQLTAPMSMEYERIFSDQATIL